MPKISVIVPVYKVEPYIHHCVESILAQTFRDFELILVDDGSPDNCGAICDEYAAKDSRIRVIHQKNGGLSAARNAGLTIARGEFISFVDSDDYVEPCLFQTVLPAMQEGCDLVAFGYSKFNNEGILNPCTWKRQEFRLEEGSITSFYIDTLLQYRIGWEACFHIFRKSVIDKYDLKFQDTKKVFAEDMLFMLCYCAHIKSVRSLDEVLYYYYQREDSIMDREKVALNVGRMNSLSKDLRFFFERTNVNHRLLQAFPIIHYLILNNVISRFVRYNPVSYQELRIMLVEDISDYHFFANNLKKMRKNKMLLANIFSDYEIEELLDIAEYYADGNELAFKIKCKCNDYVHRQAYHS